MAAATQENKKTLATVPALGLNVILERLDFKSILCLQKTCLRLYDYINFAIPDFHLYEVKIDFSPERIVLELHPEQEKPRHYIEYLNISTGCVVQYDPYGSQKTKRILDEMNYVEVFCRDLKQILAHQKTALPRFNLKAESVPLELRNVLKISCPKAVRVQLDLENQADFMDILQGFDEKVLKNISISKFSWKHSKEPWIGGEIVKTNFWRNMSGFWCNCYSFQIPLAQLYHLSNGEYYLETITSEDLFQLRNALVTRPNFDYFLLNYKKITNPSQFRILMGVDKFGRTLVEADTCFYYFPQTDKKLICVYFSDTFTKFSVLASKHPL
ncbi:hypothetical protein CAEBREN_08392 [Caenorhabditis brenneri]|uniref:DUF38 domain-containing protein n=1 Tax=Caenorhabditis brenneri TaxID=135651 RepID=G0NT03_CAEBE|nr:hypothetical protein CAEBREN_08392 [Caenorhabditis brenneri]